MKWINAIRTTLSLHNYISENDFASSTINQLNIIINLRRVEDDLVFTYCGIDDSICEAIANKIKACNEITRVDLRSK